MATAPTQPRLLTKLHPPGLLLQITFETLKSHLTSAPILHVPHPDQEFAVEVDASNVGVGAVLSHCSVSDQRLYPCAFFSCCLTPAEQNYDIEN